jgi:nanoRNase/pAp phosphatase (c-di-AMP/oligoRNAs hydrolase)
MDVPQSTNARRHARTLIRFLEAKGKALSPLLILTHDFPDPDALASAFALSYLAKHCYNINTRIAYGGIIGRAENKEMVKVLKMPVHKLEAPDLKRYAQVALVDTQPLFGNNPFPAERHATIVIDQHPPIAVASVADLTIVDTECGATSVILAQALLVRKIPIPARVATALAYGILTDTLNLYRASRSDTIKTYLDILPSCDMRALARIQHPSRSRRFFVTLHRGIQNALVCEKLVLSHLGAVENPDLVSQIADFLLAYKEIRWAVVTGRYGGRLYVSLRGVNPHIAAAAVLRASFANPQEAGGHETIAGGSFEVGKQAEEAEWNDAENGLAQRLLDRLGVSSKRRCRPSFVNC